jgi:hypothetical protein
MKIVKYGIFCVLVLVASVLMRRPADIPEKETPPAASVETSGEVMEAKGPRATTGSAETGAKMMKGQKPLMTTASDEDEEEDEDDEDEDEDEEDEDEY